jgi:hypothetical protein
MIPVLCIPALVALFFAASGYQDMATQTSWHEKLKDNLVKMDIIGLLLFTAGFGLIECNTAIWWDSHISHGEVVLDK